MSFKYTLLGNRFHIFHPLTKVVQRQSSLREKVCSILLLYLLTYFPTEKGMRKKNEESQEEFVTFLLLVCKNPHYIGWSEWVKKGEKNRISIFTTFFFTAAQNLNMKANHSCFSLWKKNDFMILFFLGLKIILTW